MTPVFIKAAKLDVLPGIMVYCLSTEYWDFFRRMFLVFLGEGQGNVTILKMLMFPDVSRKDPKIGIILCAAMPVFGEN